MTRRKPTADKKDREDKSDPTEMALASPINTLSDPDVDTDPAEEIDKKGEPFEGNHA